MISYFRSIHDKIFDSVEVSYFQNLKKFSQNYGEEEGGELSLFKCRGILLKAFDKLIGDSCELIVP